MLFIRRELTGRLHIRSAHYRLLMGRVLFIGRLQAYNYAYIGVYSLRYMGEFASKDYKECSL